MPTLALTVNDDDPTEIAYDALGTLVLEVPPVDPSNPSHVAQRVSLIFPPPTVVNGHAVDWNPTSTIQDDWGRLQVIVGGRDVTTFRGAATRVIEWTIDEPFGDSSAQLIFPGITVHDHPGEGAVAWLTNGAHIEIRLIRPDTTRKTLWCGLMAISTSDYDESSAGTYTARAIGALFQADLSVQTSQFWFDDRDIGRVISDSLNSVISRDYATCPRVTTGITTRKKGAGTPRLTGYIADLLSRGHGLDQWTVHNVGWAPRIVLKDRTTIHARMRAGQDGLAVSLQGDATEAPNVVYGEATRPDGCRVRNVKYPQQRLDDAPLFPLAPGAHFSPGGGTGGFAAFATEMRQRGYRMYSGNTYDARDEDEVRDVQNRGGILVDGLVGAQTWATVFAVGSSGADTDGAYQAPISSRREVEPYLYNPRGQRIGPNPYYHPFMLRVERYENFGDNITMAECRASAHDELERLGTPVWQGTITLKADPNEMSRWELRAGMNFLLQGHHTADRRMHIAGVTCRWEERSVTLTVDEADRDLITLSAVQQRDQESKTDPLRRKRGQRRRSQQLSDTVMPWDCEAGAGVIPRHAIIAGLWIVLKIPAGQVGQITKARFHTSGPASEFAIGIFGQPVTAQQLARLVGNPLAANRPFDPSFPQLDALGLMASWGSQSTPGGYSPGTKGETGATLTGDIVDDGGFPYQTTQPGWLWVAEYVASSCYLEGQLTAGVEGV